MAKRPGKPENLKPIPKGFVLNPTGRPKVDEDVKAVLKAATPKAAQTLVALMSEKDPKIRLRASEIILDRVYGKATQSVDVQVTDVAKIHLQALQEIQARRAKRLGVEEAPKVIDVTPHTEKGTEIEHLAPNISNDFEDLC